MKRQHPALTCDDRVRWSDESGRSRDPNFLRFREAVLAKAFRRSKMTKAKKAFRRLAGGQKLLPLMHPQKSKIAAKSRPTRSGGHSKGGERG